MVNVEIDEVDLTALHSEQNEVIVYGLSANGRSILSTEEFRLNREKYDLRKRIIGVFTGFMFLVNGLSRVSAKYNYVVIGIFALVFLVMRITGFGIY